MSEPGTGIRRRCTAAAALAALVAAIVVLVVGTADNAGGLALLLVGFLVLVAGAWHGLTRRRQRVLALLVSLLGLGALIAGFVVADWHLGRIVAVVALGLLAVGNTRIALGRDRRAIRARVHAQARTAPARQPVLIMNPKSGGGKAVRFRLEEECRRRSIEPFVLGPDDDLLRLAEDAVTRGADVIGMAGGDGSQALVASVAMRHDLPHVVVPAGTRNHFALDLGLDRDDVVGALDAYTDGVERRIDLARVNDRIFVNNATLGVYARIVQSPEYRDAKRETMLAMLPELLGPDGRHDAFSLRGPDGSERTEIDVLLVANDPYELKRVGGWGTRERLDAGTLGVTAITIRDTTEAVQFVALELAGRAHRFRGLLEWTAQRLVVASDAGIEIGIDGEALVLDPPLVFESMPGALRVRLPRRTVGASPASRAVHVLSQSTLVALVQVLLAGRRSIQSTSGST